MYCRDIGTRVFPFPSNDAKDGPIRFVSNNKRMVGNRRRRSVVGYLIYFGRDRGGKNKNRRLENRGKKKGTFGYNVGGDSNTRT